MLFGEVMMYIFVNIMEKVLDVVCFFGVDFVVLIGGGSMIGFGKVISFRIGFYYLIILIIYVGSEVMFIFGEM